MLYYDEKCKFAWPGKCIEYVSVKLCSIHITCNSFQNFTCSSCLRACPYDELRINSEDMRIFHIKPSKWGNLFVEK